MFWMGRHGTESCVKVFHVNHIIVGRGTDVEWGAVHPFGWEKLEEVISWLEDKLHHRTDITTIKEKWGGIRIYGGMTEHDKEYLAILKECINKFPGVEDYFSGMCNGIPSCVVFKGTTAACESFVKQKTKKTDAEIWAIIPPQ